MKLVVCAVFDSALQAYGRPIFVPAQGAAVRSFADEVNRAADDNPFYKHPSDFHMSVIATFDEETGQFVGEPGGPRVLSRGVDVRVKEA